MLQQDQEFQEINPADFMYDIGNDKHFVISAEIYPFDIFCFFGNKETVYRTLESYCVHDIISQDEKNQTIKFMKSTDNFFAMSPDGFSFLYVEEVPNSIHNLSVLNHEIYHVADEILRRVGIKSSHESCEAYAYFIQYLSVNIYEKLGLVVAMISEEIPSGVDIISHQKGEQNSSKIIDQSKEAKFFNITNNNPKIQHLIKDMNILVCDRLETKITKIEDDLIYFMNGDKEEFETIDAIKILKK